MDGFVITNGNGQVLSKPNEGGLPEDQVDVLTTLRDLQEVQHDAPPESTLYALVAIPPEYASYIIENRRNGLTKAAILHDMALRFIGTLEWPNHQGKDPAETAESLADFDAPADTWKE